MPDGESRRCTELFAGEPASVCLVQEVLDLLRRELSDLVSAKRGMMYLRT